MINETLLNRAKKLIDKRADLHGFRAGDVSELIALSGAILEKTPCRGCPDEQMKIYLELREFIYQSNNTNPQNQKTMSKFSIRDGVVVHDMATGRVFSIKNVKESENEILELLHRSPRSINQFNDYPDNWKQLAADWKKKSDAKKSGAKERPEGGGPTGHGGTSSRPLKGTDQDKDKDEPAAPAKPGSKSSTKPAAPKPPSKPAGKSSTKTKTAPVIESENDSTDDSTDGKDE